MVIYRSATFDDVEKLHKLLNDYAAEGLMLPAVQPFFVQSPVFYVQDQQLKNESQPDDPKQSAVRRSQSHDCSQRPPRNRADFPEEVDIIIKAFW